VSESNGDKWSSFVEESKRTISPHMERSFDYDKLAIDYSASAFRLLTYVNAGGLLAIPTAVGILGPQQPDQRQILLKIAAFFVAGLLLILLSQICAFFTMAKRAEAHEQAGAQYSWILSGIRYPAQFSDAKDRSETARASYTKKIATSNIVRLLGIACAAGSGLTFAGGCMYAPWVLG
jgi:hypothetical protein